MREVIRCHACALCAIVSSAGFLSTDSLYCSQFSTEVDSVDGCTMGTKGLPSRAVMDACVELGDHAAVYGDPLE